MIELYGGPCVGKTTHAHKLAATLSREGNSVYVIPEYAKELSMQGMTPKHPLEMTTEVFRRTSIALQSNFDVVISDCPLLTYTYYSEIVSCELPSIKAFIVELDASLKSMMRSRTVFVVEGQQLEYRGETRFQTEVEARELHQHLIRIPDQFSLEPIVVNGRTDLRPFLRFDLLEGA